MHSYIHMKVTWLASWLFLTLWTTGTSASLSCAHLFNSRPTFYAENAESIVHLLTQKFDQMLSKEEIGSYQQFLNQAQEKPSSKWNRAIRALNSEKNLTFSMRSSSLNRESIAQKGFLNQYQAKRSQGAYVPARRLIQEAAMTTLGFENYNSIPVHMRPKYGYLGSQIERNEHVNVKSYGDDIYRFKREALQNRATYTLGDSLMRMQYRLGRRIHETPGVDDHVSSWDQMFIPWSRNGVAALYLEKSLLESREIKTNQSDQPLLPTKIYNDYLELQYWGQLNLDHVESFVFTGRAPTGPFLKELRSRNILIYKLNTKTGQFVPWKNP